jgi:chemotaxis protein histidine kinase CheA
MLEIETPEEREIFSAMEQSSVRKELIRSMDKYLSVMEELAIARAEIRELKERIERLEK